MVPLTSCRYSILVRCWFNSVCHDRINTSSKIMYIACTFKEIEILNISFIFSYLNICLAVSDPSVRLFLRGWGGCMGVGVKALTFCLVRLLYSFNFGTSVPSGTLHGGWTFLDLAEKNYINTLSY